MPSGDEKVLERVQRTFTVYRKVPSAVAQPYLACVAASDRQACVDGLVRLGLVADLGAYGRELDLLAAAPGAKPAVCPANAFHRQRTVPK